MHPVWKRRVEATIPLTKCVKRGLHDFVEGFPEQGVFTRHQDIGYLQAMSVLKIPVGKVAIETVTYKKYPGNSLETQADKFRSDPDKDVKSDEELGDQYPVRIALIRRQMMHLTEKAKDLVAGNCLVLYSYFSLGFYFLFIFIYIFISVLFLLFIFPLYPFFGNK